MACIEVFWLLICTKTVNVVQESQHQGYVKLVGFCGETFWNDAIHCAQIPRRSNREIGLNVMTNLFHGEVF